MGKIIDALAGLFGIGNSTSQTYMNYDINKKNYDLAKQNYEFNKESYLKNFEYQKQLQQQLFGREDSAVQRRVADLQKSGLSKTLAAGEGAGSGPVVSTSSSSLSAPHRSQVDLISASLNMATALSDIRKVQADTENSLKQNQVMDSQLENDKANRQYTLVKMAVEQGNLDMLPLSREQRIASINLTNQQIEALKEQVNASVQNRQINDYKLTVLLPQQFQKGAEEIANLKKQGLTYDADLVYRNLQSDLLVHNINDALFQSRIRELDYYYQVNTGLKPRSASPVLGDIMGAVNSSGYNSYLDFVKDLGKNAVDGYKKIVNSFKKDKTPK